MKLFLCSIVFLTGCASAVVQHPGALNSFDNFAYDSLITEQAAINQAKTEIAQFPSAKTQLNNVIDQYDATMLAYKVYHASLTQGSNPDTTALQTSINSLVANIAALIKNLIPVPPTVPAK